MLLNLQRSLAVIDIEATGTSTENDRIVEIAVVWLHPDGSRASMCARVNPGMPIPAEATAVHGITNDDVAASGTFAQLAPNLAACIAGCDLGGFNLRAYDLPMLRAEFARAGVAWPCGDAHIVDAFVVFREREKRDLGTAVRWYCGRELVGAHGAEADANATLDVILAQVERYPDLPRNVAGLDVESGGRRPDWATEAGHFRWRDDGELVMGFGKHFGARAVGMSSGYLDWICKSEFPTDAKEIARRVMRGDVPRDPRKPVDHMTEEADAAQVMFGDEIPF